MMPRLIDTHAHVHFSAYAEDSADVLARAREAGVAMITVGTLRATSESAVRFAEQHEDVFAAVGLHPNNLHGIPESVDEGDGQEDFDKAYYLALARHPKVVGIGETGIDVYRIPDGADPAAVIAKQEASFRGHLDIATELEKPVVIHCRDGHDVVTRVLAEYVAAGKVPARGVLHCFTGTPEQALQYVALGFYISMPGILTFPPKKTEMENPLAAVVRAVPRDRLVVETDCPYLTPAPHRGERNEPSYVQFTAASVAAAWGVSADEAAAQLTANAVRLFKLPFA